MLKLRKRLSTKSNARRWWLTLNKCLDLMKPKLDKSSSQKMIETDKKRVLVFWSVLIIDW